MSGKINLFWFRRDLRLSDNTALHAALRAGLPVLPVFIFDKHILDALDDRQDARVSFIYDALSALHEELKTYQASIETAYDEPLAAFKKLVEKYEVATVYTNHDYEPYAIARDEAIESMLQKKQIAFKTFKDQVIFEKAEVVKDNGEAYSVFTPYAKKWVSLLKEEHLKPSPSKALFKNFYKGTSKAMPDLQKMGFVYHTHSNSFRLQEDLVRHYHQTRDTPSVHGTTRLGIHLRFGTISIRQVVAKALEWNRVFLHELIWREFFMQMLWHQPRLVNEACKKEYDRIQWLNKEQDFEAWCEGRTGYPLVDAGMRELNETGFMHNRVRMVTASFLVKHLLIDWRWGEAYFAKKLLDYELASNNGNWQWVAGCGCDAAPYFRIFNPTTQAKKFDPDLKYIKKWVPELNSLAYPQPIVSHEQARERCLKAYKKALAR